MEAFSSAGACDIAKSDFVVDLEFDNDNVVGIFGNSVGGTEEE